MTSMSSFNTVKHMWTDTQNHTRAKVLSWHPGGIGRFTEKLGWVRASSCVWRMNISSQCSREEKKGKYCSLLGHLIRYTCTVLTRALSNNWLLQNVCQCKNEQIGGFRQASSLLRGAPVSSRCDEVNCCFCSMGTKCNWDPFYSGCDLIRFDGVPK